MCKRYHHFLILTLIIIMPGCSLPKGFSCIFGGSNTPPHLDGGIGEGETANSITAKFLTRGDERDPVLVTSDRLAFGSNSNGNFNIYAIEISEGSSTRLEQITVGPANDKAATFNLDGMFWFISDRLGNEEIFKSKLSNSPSTATIVNTNTGQDRAPDISRDGKFLAYSSMSDDGAYYIWTYDTATNESCQYSRGQRGRWDPNGKKIVYTREDVGQWNVWVLDVESAQTTMLTTGAHAEFDPCYSPDGRFIAYVSNKGDESSNIWIMTAEGANKKQITTNPAVDIEPVWSADGRSIYFASNRAGTFDIWSVDVTKEIAEMEGKLEESTGPK